MVECKQKFYHLACVYYKGFVDKMLSVYQSSQIYMYQICAFLLLKKSENNILKDINVREFRNVSTIDK